MRSAFFTPSQHPECQMRITSLLAALTIAAVAVPAVARAQAQPPKAVPSTIHIPFTHYTLPNGLDVLLSVDRTIPQAAVDVWYHVGSKNEAPGHTGFAHLFEHVMFTGSGHVPYGMHDRLTEGVGGNNNGTTSNDRTIYFENVPSNYVESALWLESDRMGFLLDKLDEEKFVAQRDIVQNERRQGIDNQPYGRAFEILTAATLPPSNPYSWPVVGYMADLQRATVDDVRQFFRRYYAPTNATLAIVGDIDTTQVRRWVSKYFGDLPAGPAIARPSVPSVTLDAERRLLFEDRVQVPRLYLAWPSVGDDNADAYALEFLASILEGPRTARLTKALVYDRESAAAVAAFNDANELQGGFVIFITPRSGHTLAELEATTDSVLAELRRDGPTAEEMRRASAGLEFGFVSALQSNLGRAQILASGLVFHGDPAYYQTQYARLTSVTAADVQRVANRYLGPGRVVLSVVPLGQRELASQPDRSTVVTVAPDGGHYIMEPR
jgi:zinc protease